MERFGCGRREAGSQVGREAGVQEGSAIYLNTFVNSALSTKILGRVVVGL